MYICSFGGTRRRWQMRRTWTAAGSSRGGGAVDGVARVLRHEPEQHPRCGAAALGRASNAGDRHGVAHLLLDAATQAPSSSPMNRAHHGHGHLPVCPGSRSGPRACGPVRGPRSERRELHAEPALPAAPRGGGAQLHGGDGVGQGPRAVPERAAATAQRTRARPVLRRLRLGRGGRHQAMRALQDHRQPPGARRSRSNIGLMGIFVHFSLPLLKIDILLFPVSISK